jgi:hypothetical protein
MKTNKQNKTNKVAEQAVRNEKTAPELQSRSEQSRNSDSATAKTPEQNQTGTVNASVKPYVNFAERDYNRKLPVEKVLEALKRWMPLQYELAEVVGKWVWITFPNRRLNASAPNSRSLVSTGTTPANAGSTLAATPCRAASRNPGRNTMFGFLSSSIPTA